MNSCHCLYGLLQAQPLEGMQAEVAHVVDIGGIQNMCVFEHARVGDDNFAVLTTAAAANLN